MINGTAKKPRLSVFRSNNAVYAQLIDDANMKTLVSASSKLLTVAEKKQPKTAEAEMVGKMLGEKAKKTGIVEAVFDRGGYKFHGRVKAVKEGAEKAGLKF